MIEIFFFFVFARQPQPATTMYTSTRSTATYSSQLYSQLRTATCTATTAVVQLLQLYRTTIQLYQGSLQLYQLDLLATVLARSSQRDPCQIQLSSCSSCTAVVLPYLQHQLVAVVAVQLLQQPRTAAYSQLYAASCTASCCTQLYYQYTQQQLAGADGQKQQKKNLNFVPAVLSLHT